ncbi:MAG: hypothetical protein KBH93_06335 [Anaerolineae bacterium]|nr:hypothetical protein [Anaerolineae bacterium]
MSRRSAWRAWALAGILLLTAWACSVTVATAHFENVRLYREADRESTAARAFSTDETIFCLADLKDAEGQVPVRAEWVRLSKEQTDPPRTTVVQQELVASDGLVIFEAPPPDGGWMPGPHRVELYVDNHRTATLDFTIR